ncbi:hypothetical protein A176_004150 [Myxococcus hansupus]|uniref:Uncharacterized protein n=1 Tax=Pseudomyxococcus hansupus TaxID=1297742 RepID=A0A0H4X050_9BACT|nr:Imm49 family immunity protein [Myxococcus hansupus]AKQ67238.1 hypothetical protein A176_004150 [Myxococcus hansupus]
MTSDRLPLFVEVALQENQRLISRGLGNDLPLKEVLTLCQNFRLAGIGALFLSATSDAFLWRLHQSGRCFFHFLSRADDGEKLTSKCLPFFDAIAAGDLDTAREIALHAKRFREPDMEYPEDFLFVEFLMQRYFLGATDDTCNELLTHYEAALQGAEDFRLGICRALLIGDEAAFGSELSGFLSARNDSIQDLSANGSIEQETLATEGQLSVEGLALIRLAELQGFSTEEDYLNIPSIAREPSARPFQRDSWRSTPL